MSSHSADLHAPPLCVLSSPSLQIHQFHTSAARVQAHRHYLFHLVIRDLRQKDGRGLPYFPLC
jgi:hypothetical protein